MTNQEMIDDRVTSKLLKEVVKKVADRLNVNPDGYGFEYKGHRIQFLHQVTDLHNGVIYMRIDDESEMPVDNHDIDSIISDIQDNIIKSKRGYERMSFGEMVKSQRDFNHGRAEFRLFKAEDCPPGTHRHSGINGCHPIDKPHKEGSGAWQAHQKWMEKNGGGSGAGAPSTPQDKPSKPQTPSTPQKPAEKPKEEPIEDDGAKGKRESARNKENDKTPNEKSDYYDDRGISDALDRIGVKYDFKTNKGFRKHYTNLEYTKENVDRLKNAIKGSKYADSNGNLPYLEFEKDADSGNITIYSNAGRNSRYASSPRVKLDNIAQFFDEIGLEYKVSQKTGTHKGKRTRSISFELDLGYDEAFKHDLKDVLPNNGADSVVVSSTSSEDEAPHFVVTYNYTNLPDATKYSRYKRPDSDLSGRSEDFEGSVSETHLGHVPKERKKFRQLMDVID